jgi:hypothetical protein
MTLRRTIGWFGWRDRRSGPTDDGAGLDEIEHSLIESIEAAGVGEFDGDDIGVEGAVLRKYCPSPDADRS